MQENERLRERIELLESLGHEAAADANVTALVNDRLHANDKQKEVDGEVVVACTLDVTLMNFN